MRVYLTLEDTPAGLTLDGRFIPSGCSDHSADSLACLVSIGLVSQLMALNQKGLLKVDVPSIRLQNTLSSPPR